MSKKYLIDESTLIATAEALRQKTNTLVQIDPQDFPSRISDILTGDPVTVTNKHKWTGTLVPNTGNVEKIYFNTALTTSEVISELEKLSYTQTDVVDFPFPVCVLFATEDFSTAIFVSKCLYTSGDLEGQSDFDIIEISNFGQDSVSNKFLFSTMLTQPQNAGWKVNADYYVDIHKNVLNDYSGLSIGAENFKILSLFSSTEFSQEPIKDWQGTIVPNSGVVEKVYFNTNLSIEEVVAILDTLNIQQEDDGFGDMLGGYQVCGSSTSQKGVGVIKINSLYCIVAGDAENQTYIFASGENNVAPVGWNTEINFYGINDTVSSDYGLQNDKLSSLFSSTQFKNKHTLLLSGDYNGSSVKLTQMQASKFGWYGEPLPLEGKVERVYLNTNLSIDEVLEIIRELPFIDNPGEGDGKVSSIVSDLTLQNCIYIYFNAGVNKYFINHRVEGVDTVLFSQSSGWVSEFKGYIDINIITQAKVLCDTYNIKLDMNNTTALFSLEPFTRTSVGKLKINDYLQTKKLPLEFNIPVWDGSLEGAAKLYSWVAPVQTNDELIIEQVYELHQSDTILEVK